VSAHTLGTVLILINLPSYIFAADSLDHVIGWCPKKVCNDGELIDVVLAWEEWLSLQHLCEDAANAPYVNLHIIFLPCKHNLRCPVVASRDVARHLGVLDTGKSKVANLEIAVLVDQDVAGLQIPMDDPCRMDIFESSLHPISTKIHLEGKHASIQVSGTRSIV
jgi:hypothetical protein